MKRGATLIELLIVILILAMITAFIFPIIHWSFKETFSFKAKCVSVVDGYDQNYVVLKKEGEYSSYTYRLSEYYIKMFVEDNWYEIKATKPDSFNRYGWICDAGPTSPPESSPASTSPETPSESIHSKDYEYTSPEDYGISNSK